MSSQLFLTKFAQDGFSKMQSAGSVAGACKGCGYLDKRAFKYYQVLSDNDLLNTGVAERGKRRDLQLTEKGILIREELKKIKELLD